MVKKLVVRPHASRWARRTAVGATLAVLAVAIMVGMAGKAGAAEQGDPHKVPVFTCDTMRFDPQGDLTVTMQVRVDGVVDEWSGVYSPDADHIITVPVADHVAGKKGEWRASLPDVFPGVWTAWAPFDCSPPPVVVPPVVVPPAEVVPPVVVEQTPVPEAVAVTPAPELAYTGSSDTIALVGAGFIIAGLGSFALGRKVKGA